MNVGAGSITCNYDGVDKHPTVIGDGAFIGSDTMLVAPVTVGRGCGHGCGKRDQPRRSRRRARRRAHRAARRRGLGRAQAQEAQPRHGLDGRFEHRVGRGMSVERRMMVFSGTSNPELAEGIANHLGVELSNVKIKKFANGEIYVRFLESVRGADVFLIQSMCEPDERHAHGAAHHDRRGQARLGRAASPRSSATTATRGRTRSRPRASRSPRSSSPTCCRSRASTASSRWTCTRARSRASSTAR